MEGEVALSEVEPELVALGIITEIISRRIKQARHETFNWRD